jgi:hypothetical protein
LPYDLGISGDSRRTLLLAKVEKILSIPPKQDRNKALAEKND